MYTKYNPLHLAFATNCKTSLNTIFCWTGISQGKCKQHIILSTEQDKRKENERQQLRRKPSGVAQLTYSYQSRIWVSLVTQWRISSPPDFESEGDLALVLVCGCASAAAAPPPPPPTFLLITQPILDLELWNLKWLCFGQRVCLKTFFEQIWPLITELIN